MKIEKDLLIDAKEELRDRDSENQTFGCRSSNPNACKNCFTNCCAFVSPDSICRKPPRTWSKCFINKDKQMCRDKK